jgi:hypothetical protein
MSGGRIDNDTNASALSDSVVGAPRDQIPEFLIDPERRQRWEADLAFGNEDPTSGHYIKCDSQIDEAVMIT